MAAQPKQLMIQNLYIKDLSFEAPNSPQIFREQWQPEVEFNLQNNHTKLAEGVYEATLTVTVTVKSGEKTAFLVEVVQAGIFTIQGFTEEEMGPLLGIYCPNTLYPYAREVVSSLSVKGGFMPLVLPPVNFEAIYAEQLRRKKQAESPSDNAEN